MADIIGKEQDMIKEMSDSYLHIPLKTTPDTVPRMSLTKRHMFHTNPPYASSLMDKHSMPNKANYELHLIDLTTLTEVNSHVNKNSFLRDK